jgi:hypothetical protein
VFSLTNTRACLPHPPFRTTRFAPRNEASPGSLPLAILPVSASGGDRYLLRGGQACERLPAQLRLAEAAPEWRASGERFCLFLFCLTLRLRLVLCSRCLPSVGLHQRSRLPSPAPSPCTGKSPMRASCGSAPGLAGSKRFSHTQSPRRTRRDKIWRGGQLCVPRLGRNYDSITGWRRRSAAFR